jgi:hypothetical protein
MSKYEWESGSLKIPSAEWGTLKRKIRTAWNDLQENLLASAQELHQHLEASSKGKRGFDFKSAAENWAKSKERRFDYRSPWARSNRGDSMVIEAAQSWVLSSKQAGSSKPKAPKKAGLSLCPAKFDRMPGSGHLYWEAGLFLDDKTKTLHWSVSENNHAREWAWGHPMGAALHQILNEVKWTRGSGGVFVGNDEYNRDNDYEGGGANYVTRGWGPLSKR